MRIVIVTGLSGAGKSQVIRSLEDFGFYCIDNMPPAMAPMFVDVCHRSQGKFDNVALVMDIRGGELFNELHQSIDKIREGNIHLDILFLDASDDVLIKRYKESRRKHPLAEDGRIEDAIQKERAILSYIKTQATHIIDTTDLLPKQLRDQLANIFLKGKTHTDMVVNVLSFGFKYGLPKDADLVFDVRCLPNPFYIPELKQKSGMDKAVNDYVLSFPQSQEFLEKIKDLVSFSMPYYVEEGKTQLVIALGCTGGKHRSVTFAQFLGNFLNSKEYHTVITHRDIEKDKILAEKS
ncbi:MAG: RNase adapter RapZ [Hyphomonadaceae bacterium]|nr:RNase adapter RapZ [Clostridia bacterium]